MNINPQKIDKGARDICNILQNAGFQAYIVGGCVRDLFLETTPKDWDICTDASPEEVIKLFPKTYPTGLQHGTVTVANDGINYEVTTFRADGEYTDGRRPDNVLFVKNIEEDLLRRDFTINAIAYDPINNILVDPFHGIKDLENKTLRAVGHAVERFNEDGLRVMRAARFAARLNYTIEHTTLTGMAVCSHNLDLISKERIKDEFVKILQTERPSVGLQLLHDIDAFENIIPHFHKEPIDFKMDMESLDKCGGMYETKLAILMYEHGSMTYIEEHLKAMTFSNNEINNVLFILKTLEVMEKLYEGWFLAPQLPPFVVRKGLAFIKNSSPYGYGEGLNQFMKFTKAIKLSGMFADLMRNRNQLVWGRSELQISGKDLIKMGVAPGPSFKRILDGAYEEIIVNPDNNNKEFLTRFVNSWINPTNVTES